MNTRIVNLFFICYNLAEESCCDMSKKIVIVGAFILSFFAFNLNVKAACGAGVYVGDEVICLVSGSTESNNNNTAYAESSKLVLKNYNGGRIHFYSGLGNPSKIEIELIGDNYITSEDGYGILAFTTGINFVGDGTLTIKSKMPFVSVDANREGSTADQTVNSDIPVSTIKIIVGEGNESKIDESPSSTEKNEDVILESEDNKDNKDAVKEDKNDLIIIALIASCCISLLCLILSIVFIIKNNKLKKLNN